VIVDLTGKDGRVLQKRFARQPPMLDFLRMRRRNLLQLISVSALSPGFDALRAAEACRAISRPGRSRIDCGFFRPDENELLDALMEMIIPADAHSSGAREAKVSLFADWMVSHDRRPRAAMAGRLGVP